MGAITQKGGNVLNSDFCVAVHGLVFLKHTCHFPVLPTQTDNSPEGSDGGRRMRVSLLPF